MIDLLYNIPTDQKQQNPKYYNTKCQPYILVMLILLSCSSCLSSSKIDTFII